MKIQSISIIRSFRAIAAASPCGPALCNSCRQSQPTSALVNPEIARFCFRPIIPNTFTFFSATATTDSARRWPREARTVCSAAGKRVVEGNNEYTEDASLRENDMYPRPQVVAWQKELANRVHLVGVIAQPVQFNYARSGIAVTRTTLEVAMSEKTTRFPLIFFGELAETAAEHLKENDRVCVLGQFSLWRQDGQDDKPREYEVIARTLNFIERKYPHFSQQVVVDKNTPSSALFRQEVINRDTLQYQKFTVKSCSSGKNAQESTDIERLWQAYFANPLEWWDNRTNKRNPKAPDFKHKHTGEALWIVSKYSPPWVRSQLSLLDSKLKVLCNGGEDRSCRRSRGSLSSFHSSDF